MKTHVLDCSWNIYGLILALALLFPAAVSAEPVEPASDAEILQPSDYQLKRLLVDLVYTHDRVMAAKAQMEASEQGIEQAWAGWRPTLDLTVEAGLEAIQRPGGAGNTDKWRNVERLEASQLLYDFGRTGSLIGASVARYKQSEAYFEQVVDEIIFQGVAAYLQLIRAWETLKYAKQTVEQIKELSGMEETLVQRGAGLSYKELQIKGQLAGTQSYQVTVERQLMNARNRFRSLYGFDIDMEEVASLEMTPIPYSQLPPDVDTAVEIAFANNPVLLQALYAVEQFRADVDYAEANFYPELNLNGDIRRRENDVGVSGVRQEQRIGVEVSYNLYNGGADSAGLKAAKATLVSGKKQLLDSRRTVEEAVRNAWLDLMTLQKNAELYRNQADITFEFLNLIKRKRLMGETVELLDILVGERDYISATSASVTAEIDTVTAAYSMLYQMGKIDMEMFAQPGLQ